MEASNADGLERSSEGGVARLALAKPPRNLLDPDVMTALREAILEADADGDVQAIVLTGAGEMFCGGLDIERIQAGDDPVAFASALVELLRVLPTLGKPVIAAVNGDALASGYSLVCAADIAVTVDTRASAPSRPASGSGRWWPRSPRCSACTRATPWRTSSPASPSTPAAPTRSGSSTRSWAPASCGPPSNVGLSSACAPVGRSPRAGAASTASASSPTTTR